jgi:hypothetical protein
MLSANRSYRARLYAGLFYTGLLCLGIGVTTVNAQTAPGCPAYPAMPDANCTGWQHTGVTLSTYSGPTTITTAGTVIDSKLINSDITIAANNVTIKRSQVNGQIFASGTNRTGVLIEDVYVDGGDLPANACIQGFSSQGGANAAGWVMRRMNIVGCSQGIQMVGYTLEESYIHDLYGTSAAGSHTETILAYDRDIIIRHNKLVHNYRNAGGCCSSATVAIYSHPSFWADVSNIVLEKNEISAPSGATCLYAGGSPGGNGNQINNGIYRDNIFVRRTGQSQCGQGNVLYWPDPGSTVCWSGNKLDNGVIINSQLPACQQSLVAPPTSLQVR